MGENPDAVRYLGDSDLISERKFSQGFASFWRSVLPMGETYTRRINHEAERFAPPMQTVIDPQRSAFISELGFRYYSRAADSFLNGLSVNVLPGPVQEDLATETWNYIRTLSGSPKMSGKPVPEDWVAAEELARRLAAFFWFRRTGEMVFYPRFPGCGMIDDSVGDVLSGYELYEVKNVERDFRSIDLRQVLIYCALAYAAELPEVRSVCLVNARQGIFYASDLEEVAWGVAGTSVPELMSQIVWFISSEPQSR